MRLPLQEKDKTHLELHVHNLIQAGVISIFERNKLVLQIPTQILSNFYSLKLKSLFGYIKLRITWMEVR